MRSLILAAAIGCAAVVLYAGSPFLTAWNIREAVRNGNSGYLATAIDWPSVRETLKPSIARIALDLPDPEQTTDAGNPSLWQRFKSSWGQGAVDRLIEMYVTPEGLPKLFTMRKAYRDYVSADDGTRSLPVFERIRHAWARVKRAEFTRLTTFEIEMADKNDPTRLYLGKLQLTRTGWKLTELRIKFLPAAKNTATQSSRALPFSHGEKVAEGRMRGPDIISHC
jgi:hypothetical protein